jgi:hypothetical protein
MPTEQVTDETAATVVTTSLGLVGGLLSVLLGPDKLSSVQKVGCILAGGLCAFVGAPLVTVMFPTGGPRVVSLAGFVLGLSGLFIIRGFLTWTARAEKAIPDQIDKQTGVSTKPPFPPLPPAGGKDSTP